MILELTHSGPAALVDREVPVDIAAFGVTTAALMDIAEEASSDELGHGREGVDEGMALRRSRHRGLLS